MGNGDEGKPSPRETKDTSMRLLINVDVPALGTAIDFYCAALGLHHTRTLDDDVAELQGAGPPIYLLRQLEESPSAGMDSQPRRFQRHWTPVHLDFVVDDLDAAAARAEGAGAVRESPCIEWRGSRCLTYS